MKQIDHSYSRAEFLALEYKLLVDGKIVPDAGAAMAQIETRLFEIKQELRTYTEFATELPLHVTTPREGVPLGRGRFGCPK